MDGELLLKIKGLGGQFNLEERERHINTLKATLYGSR